MVRLSDLHPEEAQSLAARTAVLEPVELDGWIDPPPLASARVALVTTAGLHHRDDRRFSAGAGDFRVIPDDIDPADLVMSHLSVNFDRSAFQQDPNVWFPLDRLREMEADGEIGGISRWHYAFMGGIPTPMLMEQTGQEVGRFLRDDGVDVVILIPV